MADARFRALDANRDGKVTLEEMRPQVEARFRAIVDEYTAIAERLGFAGFTAIPMAARAGLNLASPAAEMPWYDGPTLIAHLESIELAATDASGPLRFPVQWVNRPDAHFRGYAGTIVAGQVKPGDPIVTARSGKATRVARIVTVDGMIADRFAVTDRVGRKLDDAAMERVRTALAKGGRPRRSLRRA
jgi:bifunctional enzyme CysN/CysC